MFNRDGERIKEVYSDNLKNFSDNDGMELAIIDRVSTFALSVKEIQK